MNLFSPPEWVEQTFKDTRRGILSVCALDPIYSSEEWHNQTAEIEQKASLILIENEDCIEFHNTKTHYDIGISGLIQLRNQIEYWFELALWCDPKDLELTDWDYIESQLQHCWNLVQDAVSKLPAVSTVHNMGEIEGVIRDIKDTYLDASTDAPWRMGISWGKDSTSVLQLTLEALNRIPKENWVRPIYLTTSDTHLELPPMLNIIRKNTHDFKQYIDQTKIPFEIKVVEPNLEERFFTNLIGKGYTSPLGGHSLTDRNMAVTCIAGFCPKCGRQLEH